MRKLKRGFTLVELVIVIAVIAILSAVLIPTFAGILERAKNSVNLQKATQARDELFASSEMASITEMENYLILVDDKFYLVTQSGELEIQNENLESFLVSSDSNYNKTILSDGVIIYIPIETTEQEKIKLAAGSYYKDGSLQYTWDELIALGYLSVSGNTLDYIDCMDSGKEDIFHLVISDEITVIGENCYYGAHENGEWLTILELPDNLQIIEGQSLEFLNVTELVIPASVKSIGDYAFQGCHYLEKITILGCEEIADGVFNACMNLTEIILPSTLKKVGYQIASQTSIKFNEYENGYYLPCKNNPYFILYDMIEDSTSFVIHEDTVIIAGAFYSSSITNITIPNNIISLGNLTFYECSDLISITMSQSLQNIGHYAFGYCTSLTSLVIPSGEITIDSEVFSGCSNLKSVTISDGVISIGNSAFRNCTSLTSIEVPTSVKVIDAYAFYGCTSLSKVTFSSGITSIGDYAFYNCTNLTGKIIIPNSLKMMGRYVFTNTQVEYNTYDNCNYLPSETNDYYLLYEAIDKTLSSFNMHSNTKIISSYAIYNCKNLKTMVIPNGVISIGNYAFYNCSGLTSINVPASITDMGVYAFYSCSGLTSVNLSEGLTQISSNAFSWCSNLTVVTIPSSVSVVGNSAFNRCLRLTSVIFANGTNEENTTQILKSVFYDCTALSSIYISSSVSYIDSTAFKNCSVIETINVDEGNKIFDSRDNCNAIIETRTNTLILGSLNTSIPETVTSIGEYAFAYCKTITSITIPSSVKSFGYEAFIACSGLTKVYYAGTIGQWCEIVFVGSMANPMYYASYFYVMNENNEWYEVVEITIPSSVNKIGNYVFSGFDNLTSVIISEGVNIIGYQSFYGCTNLISIIIQGTVTDIGWFAFYGCTSLTSINIPEGVTSIGGYAFYNCTQLESISIPENVLIIKDYAFNKCTGLNSIFLPSSISNVGYLAFDGCSNLENVYYYGTMEQWLNIYFDVIYSNPMYYASNFYMLDENNEWNLVTSITISSTTSINSYVFYGFENLSEVYYDGTIEDWCRISFANNYSNPLNYANKFYVLDENNNRYEVSEIVITDSVEKISNYAFYGYKGLSSVLISEGVAKIGGFSFYGCTNLKTVIISSSLKNIEWYAFYGCTNLTSITFLHAEEDSLSIGSNSFYVDSSTSTTVYVIDTNSINQAIENYSWGNRNITYSKYED